MTNKRRIYICIHWSRVAIGHVLLRSELCKSKKVQKVLTVLEFSIELDYQIKSNQLFYFITSAVQHY